MSPRGVLSIERAGPAGSLRRRLLIDGEPALVTTRDVVRALELEDETLVDARALAHSIAAEEPTWAHQRALRLLNHRERSTSELEKRLHEDGYSTETIRGVVDRLVELGLVDDARFAATLVRSKVLAGWGLSRVRHALRTAGIDDNMIETTLDEEYPDDDLPRMREVARRVTVRTPKDADHLVAKLVRRGYDISLARQVAGEARMQTPED